MFWILLASIFGALGIYLLWRKDLIFSIFLPPILVGFYIYFAGQNQTGLTVWPLAMTFACCYSLVGSAFGTVVAYSFNESD